MEGQLEKMTGFRRWTGAKDPENPCRENATQHWKPKPNLRGSLEDPTVTSKLLVSSANPRYTYMGPTRRK